MKQYVRLYILILRGNWQDLKLETTALFIDEKENETLFRLLKICYCVNTKIMERNEVKILFSYYFWIHKNP